MTSGRRVAGEPPHQLATSRSIVTVRVHGYNKQFNFPFFRTGNKLYLSASYTGWPIIDGPP